jgi:colanic acid/amylovoran biosynthesis glycosyltransferase
MTAMQPTIGLFVDHLLYPSETFIRTQARAMTRVKPFFLGSRTIPGISLGPDDVFVVNRSSIHGRIKEACFKVYGVSPYLRQVVRQRDPIAIHAHFGPNGVRILRIAEEAHKPLLVTFHGSDATISDEAAKTCRYGHRVYVRKRHILQEKGELFIAVSRFIAEHLLAKGYPPEKVVVHYIGVDTTYLVPDDSNPRAPYVLFVGRLVEKKGCQYLIQAMAKLERVFPDAKLIIIGDGPLRNSLEQAARSELTRFRFLGTQPSDVVRSYMRKASLLVVPSIQAESGETEGLPTVLIEALALKLPVVASASGGIPEAITDGENGFLIPEKDVRSISDRVGILLGDPQLRTKFGEVGRCLAESRFDVKNQSRELENLYFKTVRISPPSSQRSQPAL